MQPPLYAATLAQPLASIALAWLERCPDLSVGEDMRSWRRSSRAGSAYATAAVGRGGAAASVSRSVVDDHATGQVSLYIASPPSAALAARRDAELDVPSITAALRPDSIAAVNLAQRLVTAILPHALSKQVDVHYGLLRFDLSGRECPDTHRREPLGRRLLAVPFTARCQPSLAADFADADVRAVNTCLAYAYNGMRAADVREWAASLQTQMRRETGPVAARPSAVAFADALRAAGEAADANGDAGSAAAAASVPPLDLLALGDSAALLALHRAVSRLPHVTASWLDSAFERTHRAEELQLAASGHDLGADAIFGQRLGFTGTPNSLVPLSLLPVRYDRGEEATTLRVLTSPDCVSVVTMGRDWSTLSILQWAAGCLSLNASASAAHAPAGGSGGVAASASGASAASAQVPFTALIDAGALITQLTNREVAAALLLFGSWGGRPWHCDGVTYIDERGDKYVLEKPPGWLPAASASADGNSASAGCSPAPRSALPETITQPRALTAFQALLAAPPVALSRSGASVRFVFFDHVHTTGTDVPMPPDAVGACTLGAANTYRDFAQSAWRLRRLGKGQTLHVLLVHEIASLACTTVAELSPCSPLSAGPAAAVDLSPSDVACWLLSNTLQQETLQARALAGQRLAHCWRAPALETLLATRCKQPTDSGSSATGSAGAARKPAVQLRTAPQTFTADMPTDKPGDQNWKHFGTLSPFAGDAEALSGVVVTARFTVAVLTAGTDAAAGEGGSAEPESATLPADMPLRLSAYGAEAAGGYMLYHDGAVKLDARGCGSVTFEVTRTDAAQLALWASRSTGGAAAGAATSAGDADGDARTLYVEVTNPFAAAGAVITVSASVVYLLQPAAVAGGSADVAGGEGDDADSNGLDEAVGAVSRWAGTDDRGSASGKAGAAAGGGRVGTSPSLLAVPSSSGWRPVDVSRLQQLQTRAPDLCAAAAAAISSPHWDADAGAVVGRSLSAALAAPAVPLTDGTALAATLAASAMCSARDAPADTLLRTSLAAFQSRVDRGVPSIIAPPRPPAADVEEALSTSSILLGLAAADDRRLAELAVTCSGMAGSASGSARAVSPAGTSAGSSFARPLADPDEAAGSQAHTLDTEREVLHEELREREVQREAQAEVQRRDRDWDPRTVVWPLADALQLYASASSHARMRSATGGAASGGASQWWHTRLCDFGWSPSSSAANGTASGSGAASGAAGRQPQVGHMPLPSPPELLVSANFARRGPAIACSGASGSGSTGSSSVFTLPRRLHDARVLLTLTPQAEVTAAAGSHAVSEPTQGLLLTLREAETVRRALWSIGLTLPAPPAQRGSLRRTAPGQPPVVLRLWLLPSGRGPLRVRDSSKLLAEIAMPVGSSSSGAHGEDSDASAPVSFDSESNRLDMVRLAAHARFFNGCTDLSPREVLAVGSTAAVSSLPLAARAALFALLVDPGRRKRDVGVWEGTPAAPLYAFASGSALHTALADLALLAAALRRMFGSLQDAFVGLCAADSPADAAGALPFVAAASPVSPISPGHTAAAEASAGLTLKEFADRCAGAVAPSASGVAGPGGVGWAGTSAGAMAAAPSRSSSSSVSASSAAVAAAVAASRLPEHAKLLLRFQAQAGGGDDGEGSVVRWPDISRLFSFALEGEESHEEAEGKSGSGV